MDDVSSIKLPNGTTYTVKDSVARNHIGNGNNPHGVTKSQVGLGNVDNTADSSKVVKGLYDYNDAGRTIYIGYAGNGLTTTKYFAAYDSSGTKIKDITPLAAKAVMSLDNVANYDQSKAIKSISRSGTTFTATALDGTTFTFTQQDLSDLINNLSIDYDIPEDNDYFISQYAGGGTSRVSYHRRPVSKIWSYINAKADSVYQPKGSYASTAVATQNANGLMSSADKTKLDSLSTTSVSAITNSEIDSIVAS